MRFNLYVVPMSDQHGPSPNDDGPGDPLIDDTKLPEPNADVGNMNSDLGDGGMSPPNLGNGGDDGDDEGKDDGRMGDDDNVPENESGESGGGAEGLDDVAVGDDDDPNDMLPPWANEENRQINALVKRKEQSLQDTQAKTQEAMYVYLHHKPVICLSIIHRLQSLCLVQMSFP